MEGNALRGTPRRVFMSITAHELDAWPMILSWASYILKLRVVKAVPTSSTHVWMDMVSSSVGILSISITRRDSTQV